jgi:hypothetical protein
MKLRQLFESKSSTVGIIFGRFNPPHMGHMKAWEMASENDNWFVGTNQSTEGPKDPLPYDIKVKAMQAVWPEIKGHIVAETSWLTLASKIYKKYGSIVLNVYTDEDWVTKTLIQYNGKEGAHGFYNFKDIAQQTTPRLSSATALRNAVAADDRDLFGQAAGVDPNTLVAGQPFFDVVKHYLMPHAEKAAAKVAKKKVKQPEKDVAENNQKPRCLKWTYSGQWPNQVTTCVLWDGPTGAGTKPTAPTGNTVPSKPIARENAWDRLQRERALESAGVAEEAAGVGIITKQNTTVDVNKNTPKKNLKAFRLA